jgi:hypothetical protein
LEAKERNGKSGSNVLTTSQQFYFWLRRLNSTR